MVARVLDPALRLWRQLLVIPVARTLQVLAFGERHQGDAVRSLLGLLLAGRLLPWSVRAGCDLVLDRDDPTVRQPLHFGRHGAVWACVADPLLESAPPPLADRVVVEHDLTPQDSFPDLVYR